jgi:hypothetical protein
MTDRPRFALRFISGKYQGGEFPLRVNREIIIGRSSDLDMVLVEDMVSRRHAKITTTDAEITIQDVGSTNGTFVNGEKIAGRARLSEGRSHPGRHLDHQGGPGQRRRGRDHRGRGPPQARGRRRPPQLDRRADRCRA